MKDESVGVVADRPTVPSIEWYRSRVLLVIGFSLCCSAGLLLTAGKEINQAAYVDPYIYAGYIQDYPALLARFATTYYSERIAFIYPERLFSHLFGVEGGYLAFRFTALAAATAAVFAVGLRFYGYAPAVLAAVGSHSHPGCRPPFPGHTQTERPSSMCWLAWRASWFRCADA